jgi:hypothetical protein
MSDIGTDVSLLNLRHQVQALFLEIETLREILIATGEFSQTQFDLVRAAIERRDGSVDGVLSDLQAEFRRAFYRPQEPSKEGDDKL